MNLGRLSHFASREYNMNKKLRILLINAVNTGVEVENRYPHLGFGYLISYARKNLSSIELEFKVVEGEANSNLTDFVPDIVGISSVSQNFTIAQRLSDFYGCRGIPVIIGGIHISVLPDTLPKSALAGCIGEGEQTFAEILRLCSNGKLREEFVNIAGLVYWKNHELKHTEPRIPLDNLDEIPAPDRSHMVIGSHAHMFTSRGCPYRCVFCASTRFWDKLRFHSAEYVADEIEFLYKNYHVKIISFFDDLFVANLERMKKLKDILEEKHLLGKIKYTTNCRANLVTVELARTLKSLGVVSVGLGLESGDEETLRFLKTGNVTVEQNHQAINIIKNEGIFANASFVIGSPDESEKQVMATYRFIKNSRLDLFDIYFLTPYPGTPVWDYSLKKGIISNDMKDWSRLDVNAYRDFDKVIFVSDKIAPARLVALYKKFRLLRLIRNSIKVWRHPLLHMVPKIAFMMCYDYLRRLFARIKP